MNLKDLAATARWDIMAHEDMIEKAKRMPRPTMKDYDRCKTKHVRAQRSVQALIDAILDSHT